MTLIAESGATKCDWAIIDPFDNSSTIFRTRGINLAVNSEAEIQSVLNDVLLGLNPLKVKEVWFYGAGIVNPLSCPALYGILKRTFRNAEKICMQSDLMAAAHATFGNKQGIVAIMGTGSNCAMYDGSEVDVRARSGGFILGDEGSGARLGKMFISDFIKGTVPEAIAGQFKAMHPELDYEGIVQKVYREEAQSRFLASLAKELFPLAEPGNYLDNLLRLNCNDFFDAFLPHYDTENFSLGIVGKMACMTEKYIRDAASEHNVRIERIVQSPIAELVKYHI